MKRESIIAIVLGVVLGIGVGSVVLSKTNRNTKQAIETTTSELKDNVKTKQQAKKTSFEISEPSNQTTVSKNSITIKGKGTKDSLLVLLAPNGNKIYKLENDDFSVDFGLAMGENVINMTYYPKDGGSDYQEKQLMIYYLPE